MHTFINRDYNRTESDDYKLHVEDKIKENKESIPIFHPTEEYIIGWIIQNQYE